MEFSYSPVATIIFAITIFASLYGLFYNNKFIEKSVLNPYSFIHKRKWFTLISSGFVHGDLYHLIFNMLSFYFFVFDLEANVGSLNFAIIYFAGLILSDVTTIIKNKDNPNYSCLGASGAISASMFAFILLYPQAKLMIAPLPIPIPAPLYAILFLGYCYYASKNGQDGINHDAHFWGALSGVLCVALISPESFGNFWAYFMK
jgi:membrane associated rhomboid family serine protease